MNDEISLSLPGQLRNVFRRVYRVDPKGKNMIQLWAEVLDCASDSPEFFERLAIVSRACDVLSKQLSAMPKSEADQEARNAWVGAVNRLSMMPKINLLYQQITQGISQAHPSDVDHLATLHNHYLRTRRGLRLQAQNITDLIAAMEELEKQVHAAAIRDDVKEYLLREIRNLIYVLKNIDLFGVEAIGDAGGKFFAVAVRSHAHLVEQDQNELLNGVGSALRKWYNFVVRCGAVYGGVEALDKIVPFLFDTIIPKAN